MGRGFDDALTDKDLLHLMGVRERMKNLFDEPLGFGEDSGSAMLWKPLVDICDDGDNYLITAELPGVREDSISLQIVDGALVLKGERIPNTTENVECYHRVERPEGPFSRIFSFPEPVDAEKIKAHCEDGVLRVELPKAEIGDLEAVQIEID
jgi:HSP20 family protein